MFVPVYNVDTSETSARVFSILLDASSIEPVKIYLAVWQKKRALIANQTLESCFEKAEVAYFVDSHVIAFDQTCSCCTFFILSYFTKYAK